MSDNFSRKRLEFFIRKSFKGLTPQYIIDKVFDENVQKKWYPHETDRM